VTNSTETGPGGTTTTERPDTVNVSPSWVSLTTVSSSVSANSLSESSPIPSNRSEATPLEWATAAFRTRTTQVFVPRPE
jgi:hypothetical protein